LIRSGRVRFYGNIHTLSIASWNEIKDTGDYTLLIKRGKISLGVLKRVWENVQNEYLLKFGLKDDYKEYLEIKKEYLLAYSDWLKSGFQMRELHEMELLETDMRDYEKKFEGGMSFEEGYAWLTKAVGIHLSLTKTSMYEYYSILERELKLAKQRGKKVYR